MIFDALASNIFLLAAWDGVQNFVTVKNYIFLT